ncbi:MAG: sulfur transferase domain-containing protein [Myxococcota bacterium]
MKMRWLAWLFVTVGCGGSQQPASPGIGLANEARLESGLIVGGQPTGEVLERARQAGVTTVISLRQSSEPGFDDEREAVERLGASFVSIPIAGPGDVTEANARTLHEALQHAGEETTLLHCGSGNRVGALLALRAFHVDGRSREESLAVGRAAGLRSLASTVEGHFDACCEANSSPQC